MTTEQKNMAGCNRALAGAAAHARAARSSRGRDPDVQDLPGQPRAPYFVASFALSTASSTFSPAFSTGPFSGHALVASAIADNTKTKMTLRITFMPVVCGTGEGSNVPNGTLTQSIIEPPDSVIRHKQALRSTQIEIGPDLLFAGSLRCRFAVSARGSKSSIRSARLLFPQRHRRVDATGTTCWDERRETGGCAKDGQH